MNIKKLMAREGLLILGISICAFIISLNIDFQDWIISTKLANPNLPAEVLRERYGMKELGGIIIRRAQLIAFSSVMALYGVIRFILWAIKTLKAK